MQIRLAQNYDVVRHLPCCDKDRDVLYDLNISVRSDYDAAAFLNVVRDTTIRRCDPRMLFR